MLDSPQPQDTSIANQVNDAEEDDGASMVVSIGETEASERDWARVQYLKSDMNGTNGNSPYR